MIATLTRVTSVKSVILLNAWFLKVICRFLKVNYKRFASKASCDTKKYIAWFKKFVGLEIHAFIEMM